MAKLKTSAKREKSSAKTSKKKTKRQALRDIPIVELSPEVMARSEPHDVVKVLADSEFALRGVYEALVDGDTKAVKEILRGHFAAVNTTKVLGRVGMKQRTFYSAVSDTGNPSLDTLAQILHSIKKEKDSERDFGDVDLE